LHISKTYQLAKQNILAGIGLATLASALWSVNFIIAKDVFDKIPPVSLAFFRWSTATIIIFPFALKHLKTDWPVIKQHLLFFFFAALTGVSLFNTLVYVGAHYTSAINLALIGTTTSPVFSILLARIFLKEKIDLAKIIGLVFCFLGILYLLSKGSWHNLLHLNFSEGDLWVLAAAFSFSFYNILVKKKPAAISTTGFLVTTFTIGTALLVPFFIYDTLHAAPIQWSSRLVGDILYIGIGASVISFLCWNLAIGHLGAGRASLFGNLIPLFSSIEAIFILNEAFTRDHIISTCLVFAGLVVANLHFTRVKSQS